MPNFGHIRILGDKDIYKLLITEITAMINIGLRVETYWPKDQPPTFRTADNQCKSFKNLRRFSNADNDELDRPRIGNHRDKPE